jgi:hypothetical protein
MGVSRICYLSLASGIERVAQRFQSFQAELSELGGELLLPAKISRAVGLHHLSDLADGRTVEHLIGAGIAPQHGSLSFSKRDAASSDHLPIAFRKTGFHDVTTERLNNALHPMVEVAFAELGIFPRVEPDRRPARIDPATEDFDIFTTLLD